MRSTTSRRSARYPHASVPREEIKSASPYPNPSEGGSKYTAALKSTLPQTTLRALGNDATNLTTRSCVEEMTGGDWGDLRQYAANSD